VMFVGFEHVHQFFSPLLIDFFINIEHLQMSIRLLMRVIGVLLKIKIFHFFNKLFN